MTGKEIYERRKRLKQERMLREEERSAMHDVQEDETLLLMASFVASVESIAESLDAIAKRGT